MKKLLIISVIAFVALLTVGQQSVLAEETPESMSGGFYTRIYERVRSESHEEALKAVTRRMGISEEDIITIAQGGSIQGLRDIEGIAKINLVKELSADERTAYLELLAKQITDTEEYDAVFEEIQPYVLDRTHELIANREELASEFAFEQSLMELEMELEEEVKAIEVFADGVLDDMSGDADYSYGTESQKLVEALPLSSLLTEIFGDVSDISFEDVEELPRFDLIHDLEVIDYLIFGTGKTMKLSPAGESGPGSSSGEGGLGGGGGAGSDGNGNGGSPGSPPPGGDGTGGGDNVPPGSLNQPLDPDDMYDPEERDGDGDDYKSLQCRVGVGADLDYGPRDQLENLEESLIASNLAKLFPNVEPAEEGGIAGMIKNLSEVASLEDVGITPESLQEAMPESEFAEGECFTAEFDIIFCYKFEVGAYAEPKAFKNDNCIACHVNKINEIFGTKLLPYSLKARKNEGLTGGGSYCSDVNEAEMGMQIMAIAKPLSFYKDVCYPDPDAGTEPPLNDPARKIKEVQENYLKAVLTLQEEVNEFYRDRLDKVEQRRDASGSDASDLNAEILSIELQIIELEDQILTLRETNTLILQQWRTFKEDYEESTGCEYGIGASATDGFDSVLEEYNKELKGSVPSAHVSESVESMMTTRLLSLEPEDIASVFDSVEKGIFYKEERYKEGQEINRNAQKLSDVAEKVRMLGKEVQEMTTHFGAFKSAMESLRKPRDRSVLKKLSKKETP